MSHTPLLGLVIPTWNAADELEATLNALRALPQDLLAPLDIVVADGGSTDRTLEVLASNADLVAHVDSQTDRGVYDAMNRGVTRTRAPWIWFMGAGDLPNAEGLQHARHRCRPLLPPRPWHSVWERCHPWSPGSRTCFLRHGTVLCSGKTPSITKGLWRPNPGSWRTPCPWIAECSAIMLGS